MTLLLLFYFELNQIEPQPNFRSGAHSVLDLLSVKPILDLIDQLTLGCVILFVKYIIGQE